MHHKIIAVLVLILIGVYSLFSYPSSSCEQPTNSDSEQPIKEFNIIIKNIKFNPNKIEVNKDDIVKLCIKNNDDVTHGFGLPAYKIKEEIKAREEKHIEFVADRQGKFLFVCTVWCGEKHRNMRGQLIVK